MNRTYLQRSSLLAALLLGAGSGLLGQQAAPPKATATPSTTATPATVPASDDELIVLSPFTVNSSEDRGYTATSTLAGTRIRTELRDVGAAISVVTKDFIQDTGVTNAGTLLTYTTNTEVGGVHGNYSGFGNTGAINENYLNPHSTTRVRGLDNADNTRDYFLSSVPWDSFNIDRVDTIRGPNSILYGLGSPAGIINTTLNEANFRDHTTVELRWGRFNSGRASLDTNIVLLPKELAFRFNTEYSNTKYQEDPAFNKDFRQYGAIKYTPKFLNRDNMTTTIKVNAEHGNISSNNPEQSTPDDMITPWLNPGQANKFVTDPIGSNGIGTVPYWTFRKDSGAPNGIVTPNIATTWPYQWNNTPQADGTPNPWYNPWVSTMGFQGGTALLTGVGAQTPLGLTFWQPTISIGNYPSVTHGAINGLPYNQVNGVVGYKGYAQNANLLNWRDGLYKDKYLTDPTIFDYVHKMIQGDNARQWQNWTVGTASLAQTFYDDRFGYEAVVHTETYHSGQWSVFGGPGSINVNTDQYNIDGSVNQNFGKPFITGNGQYSNFSTDEKRSDFRITVFGELRGSDLFDANSLAAKIIGKQRITALYSNDKDFKESKNWALWATDAAYNSLYNQGTSQVQALISGNNVPHVVSYLGSSVADATTAHGLNLNYAPKINMPVDGATEQFIAKWTAPASLDPNGVWTPPTGEPGSINADNTANYQGWSTVPVHVLSYFHGDVNQLYTGGQKQETVVDSKAVIWQGFFADGTIVPMVGIRRDTVKTSYAQPPQNLNGTFNLQDPNYTLKQQGTESGTTKTYSLVLHLPKIVKDKLPLGMDISAFYNQSENFQPGTGRVDIFGGNIADPNGKTKDYGILLAFLDQKVIFKINRFDTKLYNASIGSGLATWDLGASLVWNYEFDQFYKNNYGQDWQRHFNPWVGQTQAEADAIQAAAVAAVDAIQSDPTYQKFLTAWKVSNSGTAWQTLSQPYTQPAGFAQTQDTLSKGWEYELSTQVTKNWTLTANASKTDAAVANVGGTALNQWVNYWNGVTQGPAGDIRLWWGGSTTTTRTDFQGTFMSGWALEQLGAGADVAELRPWHVNLITNYRFDHGFLNGFSAGGAYRWASHNILGYPASVDSAGAYHFDLGHPYYGPDQKAVDLWAGYDFKPGRKTTWHVQLNMRNVLASKRLVPITVQPDGSPASYRIPEPLGWEFSTRISF